VCVLVLAALAVLSSVHAAAAQTYFEDGVQNPGTQHVIVTVAPGHENDLVAAVAQHGGRVRSRYPSIHGLAVDITGVDVADLARHGAVAITGDHPVHLTGLPQLSTASAVSFTDPQPMTVSTLRASLGLSAGSARNLTGGINGRGVGVAIIDSGIAPSPDFGGRIKAFYDFTQRDASGAPATPAPYDDLGHGTHIAGLIASGGAAPGYMFQGIAPAANLIVVKALDKQGASSTSTVIAALEFIVNNQKALGVNVINLSMGHPVSAPAKFDPLVQAVENAVRHGIVVIVAAGNDGSGFGSVNSPGNSPSAITVGAADGKTTIARDDDYVPSFSSRGPTWYDGLAKPDVVAPGVNLFSNAAPGSTVVGNPIYPQQTVDGMPLVDLSGTSMASAVTTGVIALELQANLHAAVAPLTSNAAKAILEYTAIPLPNVDALAQGTGQINAVGAVQLASAINTTALPGTWWLQSGVSSTSTIGGADYAWAQNIIWGTSVLSGRFIFSRNLGLDDNIIWGTALRHGTRTIGSKRVFASDVADNIIWGTDFTVSRFDLVFGTEDGDNIIWGTNLAPFRILGQRSGSTIRWAKNDASALIQAVDDGDNIIWGTTDGDNIIWGTWADGDGDNIIWGTTDGDNIIWGTDGDNIIWGTSESSDNIIWGTSASKSVGATNDTLGNIIWGTADGDNIIWGTDSDNIIWGTDSDNIIWGTDNVSITTWSASTRGQQ
ncbi:MAG TPA: S8 family peptidase, partial [Vicinamibacterales bacterium]|nr:S8 family peptidase [Vicinamibacterales bacterium]